MPTSVSVAGGQNCIVVSFSQEKGKFFSSLFFSTQTVLSNMPPEFGRYYFIKAKAEIK
jgi:hypothetical protein